MHLDLLLQHGQHQRLGDVVVHTRVEAPLLVPGHRIRRHSDDRQGRTSRRRRGVGRGRAAPFAAAPFAAARAAAARAASARAAAAAARAAVARNARFWRFCRLPLTLPCPQGACRLKAVHDGHITVHEHQIKGPRRRRWLQISLHRLLRLAIEALDQLHRLQAVEGGGHAVAQVLKHLLAHVDVVVVVLHNKHVCGARRGRNGPAQGSKAPQRRGLTKREGRRLEHVALRRHLQRQLHEHTRARAQLRVQPDAPAHQLDQLLANGHPEADAAVLLC